jgi:glycosyltransferase involved in cell wall biosynthesis
MTGRDPSLGRLLVVATHPVQYLSPLLRTLEAHPEVDLRVLYAYLPSPEEQGTGFGQQFSWDVPVLDGYSWDEIGGVKRSRRGPHGFLGLSAPGIRERIARAAPSGVLITGWHSRVLLQAARATHRLGIVSLVRGESNDLRPRAPWIRLGHRWLLRHFDAFLAIGQANRRFYLANGVPEDRIHHAPYAVDNARFVAAAAAARPRRAELRRRWGLPEDAFVFLFAGKLETKKRPLDLLHALALARQAGSRAHLLVAGAGDLEGAMRSRAVASGLPVRFAGFLNQTEMPEAYAASDALVLPSDAGETWGLVVNEAMASGLPAVVSRLVGCREDLIVEGRTGLSFPTGDCARLAELLGELSADRAETSRMGARARERVLRSYSMETAAAGVLSALHAARRDRSD